MMCLQTLFECSNRVLNHFRRGYQQRRGSQGRGGRSSSKRTSIFGDSNVADDRPARTVWTVDDEGFQRRERAPRRQRSPPVIGTGQRRRLRVVVPESCCEIFVSRLHPETTEEEVGECVQESTGDKPIAVAKLRSRYPNYASFRISCDAKHRESLLSNDSWEEGVLVRPYHVGKTGNKSAERETDGGNTSNL